MDFDQLECYRVTATFGGETAQAIAVFTKGQLDSAPEQYISDAMRNAVFSAAEQKFGAGAAYEIEWEKSSAASLAP